jgi:hypothetical protein
VKYATQPKTPQTWCKLWILPDWCNLPTSCIKPVDFIKLHQVCEHQTCYSMISLRYRLYSTALINDQSTTVVHLPLIPRYISLQECLAETKDKRVLSRREWFNLICLRVLTNFITLALIACATYLIVEVVAGYPVEVKFNNYFKD